MTPAAALAIVVAPVLLVATGSTDARADQGVVKKDRERAAKSTEHGPVPAAGAKPAKLVNLYNEHTHEWLAVEVDGAGAARVPPQDTMNRFLRDHFTNERTDMEPRLVPTVVAAAQKFRSDIAIVVSGFRHPKYNLILRKKGHQVARDSQHTHGNAIDFYIPNIPTLTLHAWAKDQKLGGVGLYLESGFVHMDTGRVRYWSGE